MLVSMVLLVLLSTITGKILISKQNGQAFSSTFISAAAKILLIISLMSIFSSLDLSVQIALDTLLVIMEHVSAPVLPTLSLLQKMCA